MDIAFLLQGLDTNNTLGVIPVMVGPVAGLLPLIPAILAAIGGVLVSLFKPTMIKRLFMMAWSQKLIVLPIILVLAGSVTGGVMAYRHFNQPVVEDVGSVEKGSMEWSMFRGSPDRRGYVPGDYEDPAHGATVWNYSDTFTLGGEAIKTFWSSPAVMGNRVYVTSSGNSKGRGSILSLDADTGKLVWAFNDGGSYRNTFSSPTVSGRYLAVGEGIHTTRDARIYLLDLEESEKQRKGVKIWDQRTESHVESSPCIADGRVYVGAGDDGTYCLDVNPDEQGKAKVIWRLTGEKYPDCETSPVYHEGRVYFGLGVGGHAVVCVDAATGEEYWRIDTPYSVFSAPSISNGKMYFGMGHGNFIFTAEELREIMRQKMRDEGKSEAEVEAAYNAFKLTGEVWCVDLETQNVDWKYTVGRTVLGTIAVDDDRLYFGSHDQNLYCLSTDGELQGRLRAPAAIVSGPSVGKDLVYTVTMNGFLIGIDKTHMEEVWKVYLGSQSYSSPAVARGHVYIGSNNNGLLAMGEPGRLALPPIWGGRQGGVGRGGNMDDSVLALEGVQSWAYAEREDAEDKTSPVELTSSAALLENQFYIGYRQGPIKGLLSLTDSPDPLSPRATRNWLAKSTNAVTLSAAATADAVLFVDGQTGDEGRALHCIDPKTGAERWQLPVEADASGIFNITYEHLLISDRANGLSLIDLSSATAAEPRVLWQAAIGRVKGEAIISGELVFAALAESDELVALDAWTGEVVRRQKLTAAAGTGPVLIEDQLWVGQQDGLAAYPLVNTDSRRVLRAETGSLVGKLSVPEMSRIVGLNSDNEVVVVDIFTDQAGGDDSAEGMTVADFAPTKELTVKRLPGVKNGIAPLVTRAGLLYVTDGMIKRYDFSSGEDENWLVIRASWPGDVLTAPVMAKGRIYFSTSKRGLLCARDKVEQRN